MLRVVAVAFFALLVAAAPASAAKPADGVFTAPKGAVELGYDLQFKVDRGGTRISGLVAHVLERCSGSSTTSVTTVGPGLTWKVRNGRFAGRRKERAGGITLYTTFEGRFTSATTVTGIIRQESIVAGATCDTYALKFKARRG